MQQGSAALNIYRLPLKQRSDLHIARKLWHFFGVLTLAVSYQFLERSASIKVGILLTAIFIGVDLVRKFIPPVNHFALKVLGVFMREHERHGWAGTTYLAIGSLFLVWVFPAPIVTLTLLFLAVADPMASLIGIRYGKDKLIGSKSLQGTVAAFIVCTIISIAYFLSTGLMTERLLMVSLLAGLSGALSELLPIGRLDDNLSFPIMNASMLWVIFSLFGGLVP